MGVVNCGVDVNKSILKMIIRLVTESNNNFYMQSDIHFISMIAKLLNIMTK